MSTSPLRLWAVTRPDGTIMTPTVREHRADAVLQACVTQQDGWGRMRKAAYRVVKLEVYVR